MVSNSNNPSTMDRSSIHYACPYRYSPYSLSDEIKQRAAILGPSYRVPVLRIEWFWLSVQLTCLCNMEPYLYVAGPHQRQKPFSAVVMPPLARPASSTQDAAVEIGRVGEVLSAMETAVPTPVISPSGLGTGLTEPIVEEESEVRSDWVDDDDDDDDLVTSASVPACMTTVHAVRSEEKENECPVPSPVQSMPSLNTSGWSPFRRASKGGQKASPGRFFSPRSNTSGKGGVPIWSLRMFA